MSPIELFWTAKNTIYTFIFDGRKRCTSCPKEGEGGRGNSGNARKKTFFLHEALQLPLIKSLQTQLVKRG